MGFEIDKSPEDLKLQSSNINSNEQIVNEEVAAPLTNAENQELTYCLLGEAQSVGFSEYEAEKLTNGLSGDNLPSGDSIVFDEINKNNTNSAITMQNKLPDKKQDILSNQIFTFLNLYPNITKIRIQGNLIKFLDKKNTVINDINGKPLSIDYESINNNSSINLLKTYKKNNEKDLDIDNAIKLIMLQEKFNTDDDINLTENLNTVLSESELPVFKSIKKEDERKTFIEEKLYNAFINGKIMDELVEKSDSNPLSVGINNEILKEQATTEGFPKDELKKLRHQITNATSIEDLKLIEQNIKKLNLPKFEKSMLNNECIKQQGILIASSVSIGKTKIIENENTNILLPEKEDFNEQIIQSHLAFETFKKCKNPAQREIANFILADKRLYLANEDSNSALDEMIENCQTQEDVNIKKQLLNKATANSNLLENGILNSSMIKNISNATSETFDLQLKILDIYQKSSSGIKTEEDKELNDCLRDLAEFSFSDKNSNVIEFSEKIIFDEKLSKNTTALKTLLITLQSNTSDNDTLAITYNILKMPETKDFTAEDICNAATCIVNNDASKDTIENYVKSDDNENSNNSNNEQILNMLVKSDIKIYKEFVNSRNCSKDELYDIFRHTQYNYGKKILSDICSQQQYSTENIINVLKCTSDKTSDITKQVLEKKNITANEKVDVLQAIKNNYSQIELIKVVLNNDNINLKILPKFINSIKTLNEHNIKYKKDKIAPNKVDKYIQLLQNPQTLPWVLDMLNQGWDIETISQLNQTKLKFYANKNNKAIYVDDSDKKFFISAGFNSDDADEIIDVMSKNSNSKNDMKQIAIELLNSKIPRHRIGEVLNFAMTTGNYNSKVVADAITVNSLGVNLFLGRYLPIVNNLSVNDLTKFLSTDIRNTLNTMLYQLPEEKKHILKANGFDIDGIIKNLDMINNNDMIDDISNQSVPKVSTSNDLDNRNSDMTQSQSKNAADVKEVIGKNDLSSDEDNIHLSTKNNKQFNAVKSELEELENHHNYIAILKKMNIDVTELPDGTWEISHYTSIIDKFALNEFGIDENKLLYNVSCIKGNANFQNSNVTALPNLKEIGGEIEFGDNEFIDLRRLEKINKKKIVWA